MSHVFECPYPAAYHLGRDRREQGYARMPPAVLSWCDQHWWLAGWNDRDIEMRTRGPADEDYC